MGIPLDNLQNITFTDWEHTFAALNLIKGTALDVAEICGGEARTSEVGIRRHLTTGRNFDLVTGFDLCDPKQADFAWTYFFNNEVMAPVCGPYGQISNLTWYLHAETMHLQEAKVRPLARFCGHVAGLQLEKGLHFIQERPLGSWLYQVQPWPQFLCHAGVVQQMYDRCAARLKIIPARSAGFVLRA